MNKGEVESFEGLSIEEVFRPVDYVVRLRDFSTDRVTVCVKR